MGTNYYARYDSCDCNCPNCGLKGIEYHIGKSSSGWAFALHVDPDNGIHDLEDVLTKIIKTGAVIYNEYDAEVSLQILLKCILDRDEDVEHHELDGGDSVYLVGSGSYDLIKGEFS
jgi:hypothetical protein